MSYNSDDIEMQDGFQDEADAFYLPVKQESETDSIEIPPELAEGILESLNQNPLLRTKPSDASFASSATKFGAFPASPATFSTAERSRSSFSSKIPSQDAASKGKQRRKGLFDVARLYALSQWVDDVHFTLSELEWDFKTMNNWGFFCNTSLGKGIWYYIWVIPNEGPIYRRGNVAQAVQLITQQGEPSRPTSQTRIINGRPRLRLLEWRQKCGIGHLEVKESAVKYVGSRKRQRLAELEDEDEILQENNPELSIAQVFDLVGYAFANNRVTLVGKGFNYGPTAVIFGSESAQAEINFVSDNGDVIVCLTPLCPPGKVWIEVINGRGRSRYEPKQYEFVEQQKSPTSSPLPLPSSVSQEEDAMNVSQNEYEVMFQSAAFGDNELLSDFIATSGPDTINACDDLGCTALFWAVWANRLDTARLLLEAKADPNVPSLSGETALHMAADVNNPELVDLLVSYGADVNLANSDGDTPIFYASKSEVVGVLLEKGANPNLKNHRGEIFSDWNMTVAERNRRTSFGRSLPKQVTITQSPNSTLSKSPSNNSPINSSSLSKLSDILDGRASEFVPVVSKSQSQKPKPPTSRRLPSSILPAERLSEERTAIVSHKK